MMTEIVLVQKVVSKVFGDFVSKVVSDGVDVLKSAIKDADLDRKSYNQNLQTRLYQLMIDALNKFTHDTYKKQDKLYDAAESILKGYLSTKDNTDATKLGLKMLASDVNSDTCQEFLETLCGEICRDDNSDLYKEIDMLWKRRESKYAHEEFKKNNLNHEEIHRKLDYVIENLSSEEEYKAEDVSESYVESRTEVYAQKWNEKVFLNNFNKRDENVGPEIVLKNIYPKEHLPHYFWKTNTKESHDLEELLSEYVVDNNCKKMLLILGQPGIGKSTLITWIAANFAEKKDEILVYLFAPDLKNVNWQGENILNDILKTLKLRYNDLENKILILDGFDEIHASKDRKSILNQLYEELIEKRILKKFSLIITCREKYIYDLPKVECDYITLQRWNREQIQSFCRKYASESKCNISQDTVNKILENEKIFGVPLILYMVLALDISIEKNSSIVDIYDQIFSIDGGGIYDRCIKNSRYALLPHRIAEAKIKKQIHLISQKIAFWMFENKPAEAFITKIEYERICDDVISELSEENEDIKRDFLIANYFEPVRYCEGIGTDELHFVHRSIYEYFVVVYFFESIHNLASKEKVAGKLGELLKDGKLSWQICEFIKYKFNNIEEYNLPDVTREVFNVMLRDGMTYYIKAESPYNNIIEREMNIFQNMLKVVHLWNLFLGRFNERISVYLRFNRESGLILKGLKLGSFSSDLEELYEADLSGAYLKGADLFDANLMKVNLSGANLSGANLIGADLNGANLRGANLRGANLEGAYLNDVDLIGADLRKANLKGVDLSKAHIDDADLRGANLATTMFDANQIVPLYN